MSGLLPEGMVIAPFRPHAAECKEMDEIVVMTEDVSVVTKWHGLVCISHMVDGETLKGFTLVCAKQLRGADQETSVSILLKRAFAFDLESTQHPYTLEELAALYLPAAQLLEKHPTIVRIS